MPGVLPRPLTGEPLALDLVNTQWVDRGRSHDLFDEPGGTRVWLAGHRLEPPAGATGSRRVEAALRTARAALRAVLEQAGAGIEDELNAVLARGAVRRYVRDRSVDEQVEVEEHWLPAWRAAASYLELLDDHPERIRRCAHPSCVLYFYDTSRNGTRRWCSMEGCGSRAKASRHYARSRAQRES